MGAVYARHRATPQLLGALSGGFTAQGSVTESYRWYAGDALGHTAAQAGQGWSEAESDPHAFLYWPTAELVVVPLQTVRSDGQWGSDALVLRLTGDGLKEVGQLEHPHRGPDYSGQSWIRRSLVIDQTLWTVSDEGAMVNDLRTLHRVAWIDNR